MLQWRPAQIWLSLLLLISSNVALAEKHTAVVAVATNFFATAELLEQDFEQRSSQSISLVAGSSGKLYAQISHGAPIDAFLSADQTRPMQLVRDGMVVGDIQFTYAIGRLVAWFPNVSESAIELSRSQVVRLITNGQRIAYANAALAPYGLAAIQALQALELRDQLQPRLVRGENVGQVYSLVSSGNADIGFVALAQHLQKTTAGGYWLVGESLHEPIRQDAVLLKRAANNATAKAFIDYLNGPAAQKIIQAAGYAVTN